MNDVGSPNADDMAALATSNVDVTGLASGLDAKTDNVTNDDAADARNSNGGGIGQVESSSAYLQRVHVICQQ